MRVSSLVPFLLLWVTPSTAALLYRGVDWSSVLVEERNGVVYKNSTGAEKPLETILAEAGVNLVRQRVWVTDGDYGVNYNLELARRARDAGMLFGLNLHLSHDWTNPGLQEIPPEWPTTIDDLEATVYDYVLGVCNTFQEAGLHPKLVTLGNEINSGILHPVGSYENPGNLSRLLKSASRAVKESKLCPKPKILLHLTLCCDYQTPEWFYNLILDAGPLTLADFDVQAISIYPFWGPRNTFPLLKDMVTFMKGAYGKEVQIVETNYPSVCTSPVYEWPPDIIDIPISIERQAIYIERMASALEEVSGTGLNYWEVAWSQFPSVGSSCEHATMFDVDGKAHDSLSVFGRI